ncbi:hypothetical protein [Streptomyces sp. NPDC001315]
MNAVASPEAIHMTETGDPTAAILTSTPVAFAALLHVLQKDPHHV